MRQIPPRVLSGSWWHQGPVGRPFLFCPNPSHGPGRYHRAGGPGAWYASSSMRASWCETFRHFCDTDGVDPLEVRRRAGRVRVDGLRLLDLTDAAVRHQLGARETDLLGDDYALCQDLADAARTAGLDGLLAPSAGLPGSRTLALFPETVDGTTVIEETSRVQVPPIDLVRALESVHPVPTATAAFQASGLFI